MYFFQASVLFNNRNANILPILAYFFVANLCASLVYFTGLNNVVVYQHWQISGMIDWPNNCLVSCKAYSVSFSPKLARDVEYSKKKHHSCFSGFLLMISLKTLMYSYLKCEPCLFCKMFISLLCNTIFAFLMRSVETLARGPSCTIAHHKALDTPWYSHTCPYTPHSSIAVKSPNVT